MEGGNGGCRGYRGGRDGQAASSSRPPAGQCQGKGSEAGRIDQRGGPTEAGRIGRAGTPASRRAQQETRKAVGDADACGVVGESSEASM